jgi:Polysaccharide pyruvyl transferase
LSRILLRAGKGPFTVLSPESSLEDFPAGVFGKNVGNLVFSDSMHRILSVPGSEVVANTFLGERDGVTAPYLDNINNTFDHFVVPLANAFRMSFLPNLDLLTNTIKGLKIPTTVVGVGVSGGGGSLEKDVDEVPDELKRGVKRFVNAVLDRSATIGVRGENTRRFLNRLGYGDDLVDVIGCPSLYRNGRDLRIEKRASALTKDSQFSINVSPYVGYMADASLYHAKKYPNMTYIPQDLETLRLLMWGRNPSKYAAKMPTHAGHPLYEQDRIRFFIDSRTWIDHLKTQDFSFGTRIHGNIAALVARTPAVVLVHDTRTQELAEFHDIPHRFVPDLPKRVDAAQLYEEADFTAFNAGHNAKFENFQAFLKRNNIENVFEEGKANPDYDEELAALPLPGAVRRVPAGQEQLLGRIQWMYSQLPANKNRDNYRFRAPVPHVRPTAPQQVGLFQKSAARVIRRLRS